MSMNIQDKKDIIRELTAEDAGIRGYSGSTNATLQTVCKTLGLKATGKKAQLLDRIEAWAEKEKLRIRIAERNEENKKLRENTLVVIEAGPYVIRTAKFINSESEISRTFELSRVGNFNDKYAVLNSVGGCGLIGFKLYVTTTRAWSETPGAWSEAPEELEKFEKDFAQAKSAMLALQNEIKNLD